MPESTGVSPGKSSLPIFSLLTKVRKDRTVNKAFYFGNYIVSGIKVIALVPSVFKITVFNLSTYPLPYYLSAQSIGEFS